MLKYLTIAGFVAGLVVAGVLTSTSAIAAHFGARGGAPHVAALHVSPGGAMHAPRGAFNSTGPRVYGWRGGPHHGHIHHRRGFGVIVGDYYDGGYGYYGGCEWLRVRAEETGSGYWWRRHEDCVDG